MAGENETQNKNANELREVEDLVILGTGPAGLTAAVYAARAELEPVCVEGLEAGGQLMLTTDVDNYPGYPEGVLGPDMMKDFRQQAARFGTRFVQGDVQEVDLDKRPYTLKTTGGSAIKTNALIIATGAKAKWLGLESEKRLQGKGVSACATCDGFFFKGAEVVVVGGGDTAMEEALFLTKFASKVTVVHRRDQLRASKIMQEKAFANSKIEFVWDSVVEEVLGENEVQGVRIRNRNTDEVTDLSAQGFFLAIGHKPTTDLFKGYLEMDEAGYLKPKQGSTATNLPAVFAAGDVADKVYRQAVTAAGTGCMAALDAERFLEDEKFHQS